MAEFSVVLIVGFNTGVTGSVTVAPRCGPDNMTSLGGMCPSVGVFKIGAELGGYLRAAERSSLLLNWSEDG
jgi:hypothetical protein